MTAKDRLDMLAICQAISEANKSLLSKLSDLEANDQVVTDKESLGQFILASQKLIQANNNIINGVK